MSCHIMCSIAHRINRQLAGTGQEGRLLCLWRNGCKIYKRAANVAVYSWSSLPCRQGELPTADYFKMGGQTIVT